MRHPQYWSAISACDDVCERCKAPHANPATGQHDMNVLAAPMRRRYKSPHRGVTRVIGVFGVMPNEGTINAGDEINLL